MNTLQDKDFQAFWQARIQASNDFLSGDAGPLHAVSAQHDPATILGPPGTVVSGAVAVNQTNALGSAMFDGFDRNDFEELHSGVSGDLAYWTGIQRSIVRFKGEDGPVPMDLRLTEIFRHQDGEWKLIHRHADALKAG